MESYCFEKKGGEIANNVRVLILRIESWSLILYIVIWHDLLFEISKTCEVTRTSGVSLRVVETEIKAIEKVLKKYRKNGYNSMRACAREIVEALQIDMENTPKGKRRVFGYDAEDESYELSQQDQLTTTLLFSIDRSCNISFIRPL